MSQIQTQLKILDVQQAAGRNILVVRVLSGEPVTNMILESEDTGSRWRVRGSAFVPPDAWQKETRGILVEQVENKGNIAKGERLLSKS